MALTIRETAFDDEARADFWNLPTAKFVGEQARYEEAAKTGVLKVLAAETEEGERAGTFFGLVVTGEQVGKDGNVFWVLGAVSRGKTGSRRLYSEAIRPVCAFVRRFWRVSGVLASAGQRGVVRMLEDAGFNREQIVLYKEIENGDLEDRE